MRVLFLGGGGTLGAFSAGALCALDEQGFSPDAVIGSSAGGINLLRWTAGGAAEAVRFWKDNARLSTIARGVLHGRNLSEGILDARWFRARVEEGVDFEQLRRDRRTLSFLVVDMETGRVSVRGNRTEPSTPALRAVARGAYALPPLLPPVAFGGSLLADGGLLHNAPLNEAVKLGATSIVYVCNVHAIPRSGFRKPSSVRSAWRFAEIFFRRASNVGFVDADIVDGRFRDVPFLAIAPPANLAFGSLLRRMVPHIDAVQHLVDCGHESALRAYSQWADYEAVSGPRSVEGVETLA
ncbi:MAG TPA: patatin-like phospholipase family protein [Labilithrix sp.]|nr:patatin-like phospholipase family protein [Labilithrix sp.]